MENGIPEEQIPLIEKQESRTSGPSGLEFDAKTLFLGEYFKLDIATRTGNFTKLKQIQTYEGYINKRYVPEMAKAVLDESNQENVKKVNELVAEYNVAITQIQNKEDIGKCKEILKKIEEVFGSPSDRSHFDAELNQKIREQGNKK